MQIYKKIITIFHFFISLKLHTIAPFLICVYNLINKVNLYIKFTKIYKEVFILKVKIHPNTLDKVKNMLDNSDKDALRIKACSSG